MTSIDLRLEACDQDRNIARAYAVQTAPDLFGGVRVELAWGRIGCNPRTLVFHFAEEAEAARFVARRLRRRASLQRRLGVSYRLLECSI